MGLVFPSPRRGVFAYMHNTAPRKALAKRCIEAGIDHRFTIHGYHRIVNNLVRRIAEGSWPAR